jgi:multidrug resistance protein
LPPGFRVLWLTVVIDAIGFGIVVPILGLYAEDFGASAAVVGLLVASFSAAQFVASPILGRLSDRRGRRPLIIASLVGTAVGSLLTGLAGSLTLLFVGRIVDGASGASVVVARAAAADIAEPEDRARLFGLLGAALGLGFVLGPALGGLAAVVDHRLPFFVAAAIAATNAVVAFFRLPETRPRARGADESADRAVTPSSPPVPPDRRPAYVRLLAVSFVSMAAFSGFEAAFPLLLHARLDVSLRTVSLLFAGIGIVMVGVRTRVVEPVARARGELGALRIGLVANAVGLGLLAIDRGWPLVVGALGVLVFGQGILMPVLSSSVAALAERGASGGALGWQQAAQSLARIAGPVLAGVLFDVAVGVPFAVGAALSFVAVGLVPHLRDEGFGTSPGDGLQFITKG